MTSCHLLHTYEVTCSAAGNNYYFDEFQIFGRAQLAILGDNADLFFRDMIGDRTGAVHVADTQVRTRDVTAI